MRRGLAAAAALCFVGSSAAAPVGSAWSKAWAEHQLRKHFHADSVVCLPLGPAVPQNGSRAFKEFVCVLVISDGSRYTIHLKPRSRSAWTTLSIEHGGGSVRGGGPKPSRGHAHSR